MLSDAHLLFSPDVRCSCSRPVLSTEQDLWKEQALTPSDFQLKLPFLGLELKLECDHLLAELRHRLGEQLAEAGQAAVASHHLKQTPIKITIPSAADMCFDDIPRTKHDFFSSEDWC